MIDVPKFLDSVTHVSRNFDDIDYSRLRAQLHEHSMVRVVGLFDRGEIRAALNRIADRFDSANDRKHDPRDTAAVRSNFQKLQIGANSGVDSGRTLGRFLRVLYNPIFEKDVYGMRSHFVRLAHFRNRLYDLPVDFAVESIDDGFFTCARIHQYPRGGGFMVPHRDMYSKLVTVQSGLGYYQVFVVLTERGTDYRHGGGYIDIDNERILFEAETRAGDVIVYDGRTVHGVADIDPLDPLELHRFGGRVAAFASLYQYLEPGNAGYARICREACEQFGIEGTAGTSV